MSIKKLYKLSPFSTIHVLKDNWIAIVDQHTISTLKINSHSCEIGNHWITKEIIEQSIRLDDRIFTLCSVNDDLSNDNNDKNEKDNNTASLDNNDDCEAQKVNEIGIFDQKLNIESFGFISKDDFKIINVNNHIIIVSYSNYLTTSLDKFNICYSLPSFTCDEIVNMYPLGKSHVLFWIHRNKIHYIYTYNIYCQWFEKKFKTDSMIIQIITHDFRDNNWIIVKTIKDILVWKNGEQINLDHLNMNLKFIMSYKTKLLFLDDHSFVKYNLVKDTNKTIELEIPRLNYRSIEPIDNDYILLNGENNDCYIVCIHDGKPLYRFKPKISMDFIPLQKDMILAKTPTFLYQLQF